MNEQLVMVPSKLKGPLSILEQMIPLDKIADENMILEKMGILGGPTSVREWFVESPEEIDPNDALYQLV